MYLNTVYYGAGAYGIETAAQSYFGKHAKKLTLPQAAFLVLFFRRFMRRRRRLILWLDSQAS